MIKIILVSLAAIVAIFLIVVAVQPSDFRISRSATIPAAPGVVFEHVNNLQKWNDWSPWAKLDPAAKNTFTGPESGVNAAFAWAGNDQVGEGIMTITESKPTEFVQMKLEFIKPFQAVSTTAFTFAPEGEHTKMTWTMTGTNNFMGKAMSLIMNCDKMLGTQFEEGFANLSKVVSAKKSS